MLGSTGIMLPAQEFQLFDRTVQVHGFASQGFVYTSANNWLTMNTSSGSGAMTDVALNVSSQVTDSLWIGAQVYDRNLGQLGQWRPSLDWALADYAFRPWLGVRAGKVKTVMGLYNDTQDMDFLHPFALLPQSIYQTDMRESTIAHKGGDLYGTIGLGKPGGKISYTAYVGRRDDSRYGGYPYLLAQFASIHLTRYGGLQYGGDLRWAPPLTGLLVGFSRMDENIAGDGTVAYPGLVLPYQEHSKADWTNQFYGHYKFRKLQFDSEYRRYWRDEVVFSGNSRVQTDVRGCYISGAYRATKRLQVASYYSRYSDRVPTSARVDSPILGHIYDKALTARYDVDRVVNVKLEGHFMSGAGIPNFYPSGFYQSDNPEGLRPNTNAFVARTGFTF